MLLPNITTILKTLRKIFIGAWAVIGGILLAIAVFFGGLCFLLYPTHWNFPGDPPLLDLSIYPIALAAIINVPLWLMAKRWWTGRFPVKKFSRNWAILSLVLLAIPVAGILERHGPRWAAIRDGIRQYGDEIAAATGSKDRVLSWEECREFEARFPPRHVQLPGYGMVTLRIFNGFYPYVGVDFGGGSNALFDLRTMICTYSD